MTTPSTLEPWTDPTVLLPRGQGMWTDPMPRLTGFPGTRSERIYFLRVQGYRKDCTTFLR